MSSQKKTKRFSFAPTYKSIHEIINAPNLATLGDAYINLIFSLYLSMKTGEPTGAKAGSQMLSKALKQAGLREFMSSRVDRHRLADAAESLLVYLWLQGRTTIAESLNILMKHTDTTEAFSSLLSHAKKELLR